MKAWEARSAVDGHKVHVVMEAQENIVFLIVLGEIRHCRSKDMRPVDKGCR